MAWLRTEPARVIDELQKIHVRLRSLVGQLEDQAGRAPYPFIQKDLRELEAAAERSAAAVAERLAAHGRHAEENGATPPTDGRNAWERLVRLQDGYRALLQPLKVLSVRWEEEYPEDASLIAALRDRIVKSRAVVGDLVARTDPHALD